ncbi:hypothetical protein IFM12276_39990 [Nocardia sputorum]|uniref:DUF6602 domain-containing protein n=2 Tax=Nocardiaceae TaxID=85025 RepID=A0ABM8D0V9_9NOCA|nr:hypothetical protein IFM12276_39990 [Nocardia sputorum]
MMTDTKWGPMIKTVAELLRQLMENERKLLDAVPLKHGPTIGEMYEGLSQDLLRRAIPSGLDLRLIGGFIVDGLGNTSGQIDCMLVRGEGLPIPYTRAYAWHVKDVIAVFEIKKSLYGSQLREAFQHLNEVRGIERSYRRSAESDDDPVDLECVARSFAETTRSAVPSYDSIESLPFHLNVLFHTLVVEHISPLRIIIGYHGFKSEHRFRAALYEYLEENLGQDGFGVAGFPHLIVSGNFSLVKANGEPFSAQLIDDDWWPFYFSTTVNPVLMILELIWTRLDCRYEIGGLWGEDLELEVPHAFLLAKAGESVEGRSGWNYAFVNNTAASLSKLGDHEEWSPCYLSVPQWVIVNMLCHGEKVRFDDERLIEYLTGEGVIDLDRFWSDLLSTTLVARSSDSMELVLITIDCHMAILPGGQLVAAENNTGRLFRWIEKNSGISSSGAALELDKESGPNYGVDRDSQRTGDGAVN